MIIDVIAFDVFGTLVDWRTSITAELARIGERAGLDADWPAVADAWRSLYAPTLASVRRGEREYQSLDTLHATMLDNVAQQYVLAALTGADRDELVHSWHRLTPWPDTVEGLARLRER